MRYFLIFLLICSSTLFAELPKEVRVSIQTNRPIASFDPRSALGGGIDGHWQGETEQMFTRPNIRQMLGAGLSPVAIRLRTELAVEAWHWNPKGEWSDPRHSQGYWTSEQTPGTPILISYGYKLLRRGNTLDEANDDGYGMLDDGDQKTFWKSNPYLTKWYTGEPDSSHPQWVVLDFGKLVPINEIRISWAEPYAKKFAVEYSLKGRVYFGGHPKNLFSKVWHPFPQGEITAGRGGDQTIQLSKEPIKVRYLRLWMTEGSATALSPSTDRRDSLGYAIREICAGVRAGDGVFHDQVSHAKGHSQTLAYTSSTDLWHRASDRDAHVEQPGIDLITQCGITRGLPLMLSVPVFYDTPENAAALAAYSVKKGISVGRYELGEEPDGQRIAPEDFGALYAQASRAMRMAACKGILGGPSFVTVDIDKNDDTYRCDHRPWIKEFRNELLRQGQDQNLQFLSFEWYPFDDVEGKEAEQIPRAYGMLKRAMDRLHPLGLPLVIGEANYSVFPCQQEVDLGGALLNAETAAQFLSCGGEAFYFYSYEPNKLEESSGSWGNQMMLLQTKAGSLPLATYQALRLLTQEWLAPLGGLHKIFCVKSVPASEQSLLSLFAVQRPDHTWSLLVINKHPEQSVLLTLPRCFHTKCALTTYSAKDYEWVPQDAHGYPRRNKPPKSRSLSGDLPVILPPWSLSVITSEGT